MHYYYYCYIGVYLWQEKPFEITYIYNRVVCSPPTPPPSSFGVTDPAKLLLLLEAEMQSYGIVPNYDQSLLFVGINKTGHKALYIF